MFYVSVFWDSTLEGPVPKAEVLGLWQFTLKYMAIHIEVHDCAFEPTKSYVWSVHPICQRR